MSGIGDYTQVTLLESLLHAMRASEARNRENLTQQPQEEKVRGICGSSMHKPGVKPYLNIENKITCYMAPNHCCAGMQVVRAHTCISESLSASAAARRGREHGGLGEGGGASGECVARAEVKLFSGQDSATVVWTLRSISDICIAVRSCLLLPSDDVYNTTNPNCKFPLMYLTCMYIYFKDPPQLKSQCDLS